MRVYKLQSLHCRACGDRLEQKLKSLPQGEKVSVDYEKREITVPDTMKEEDVRLILAQEKIMAFPEDRAHPHPRKDQGEKKGHGHDHGHAHQVDFRSADRAVKNIKIVFFLNLFFSIFEVVFGLLFNSMAILSDAIHDFGDSVSVGLSWIFQNYSRKEPSNRFSFGHQRFSLMGALITAVVLLGGSLFLFLRTIPRLLAPEEVNAEGMLIISLFAIAMNGYAAWLLSRGTSQNEKVLNVHMLEDVLGWVGVLLVSIVVRYTNWYILDPILSLLIATFIFVKTLPLFLRTMHIFLEGVPSHVDLDRLEEDILQVHDVHAVTHLHIWSIDGEENAMNATLFVTTDDQRKIEDIKEEVRFLTTELRVSHSTIEIISDPEKIVKHQKNHPKDPT